jgi:hypothetical protein
METIKKRLPQSVAVALALNLAYRLNNWRLGLPHADNMVFNSLVLIGIACLVWLAYDLIISSTVRKAIVETTMKKRGIVVISGGLLILASLAVLAMQPKPWNEVVQDCILAYPGNGQDITFAATLCVAKEAHARGYHY